jgi:hypothetical protein
MEIIKEFAKPDSSSGYYRFGLFLTAIHKAMEWRVIELRTASKKHLNIDLRPSTTSVEEIKPLEVAG